jgi:hypothetical protein
MTWAAGTTAWPLVGGREVDVFGQGGTGDAASMSYALAAEISFLWRPMLRDPSDEWFSEVASYEGAPPIAGRRMAVPRRAKE